GKHEDLPHYYAFSYVWVRAFPERRVRLASLSIRSASGWAYGLNRYAKSCLEYQMAPAFSQRSGVYWIKPSGTTIAFRVYCEMQQRGGGWTQILSTTNNAKSRFSYHASLWTQRPKLWDSNPSLDPKEETLLRSFAELPVQQLMLAQKFHSIKVNGHRQYLPKFNDVRRLVMSFAKVQTLFSMTSGARFVSTIHPTSAQAWIDLYHPYGRMQMTYFFEGINVNPCPKDSEDACVRIGVTGNNSTSNKHESRMGIGGSGTRHSQDPDIIVGHSSGSCKQHACGLDSREETRYDVGVHVTLYGR
ncbi:MAG: fibrinogen-like YCDxxxxGGGW domain-containing protein, partial [Myxococcota bacterium]